MKPSNTNNKDFTIFIEKFLPYAEKKLGFNKPPTIKFQDDPENAKDIFGKTAYYEPGTHQIVLFTTGRHPKDILRSLSHELVHHTQNCRGDFQNTGATQEGYAQNDPHLRKMEKEAYLYGNIIFRDFCDSQLHETSYNKGDDVMTENTLKEVINKAIKTATRGSKKAQKQLKILLEGSDMPSDEKEDLEESTEEETEVEVKERKRALHETEGETPEEVAARMKSPAKAPMYDSVVRDWYAMAEGDEYALQEFGEYYRHVPPEKLQGFAQAVLVALGERPPTSTVSMGEFEGSMDEPEPTNFSGFGREALEIERWRNEVRESREKPLKEWYGNSLYKKLIKEYTRRK
jgi:hypothetical protein